MRHLRVMGIALAALLTTASGVARAATAIWGGGTGTWGTAANWLGGAVPAAGDTASFTGWVPMSRTGWTVTSPVGSGASSTMDGSWNTRWTTGSNAASGNYIRIDLGSTQSFSRIVLDDTNDGSDYPPGFDVYVSADGSTWGAAIASGTGAAPLTTIDVPAQSARYIKVQLNAGGTHWWSIREIFVYTTGLVDDTQLSRAGWTASASTNTASAAQAIDASLATRWDSGTNATAGQWFKVDLGAQTTVDRVDFSAYTDSNDFPPAYKVQLSTDDVTYGGTVASGTGSVALIGATFTAQTARYILITCTGAGTFYWSIHDVNVYGTPRGATLASSTSIAALTLGKGQLTQGTGASLTLSGGYAQSGGTFTGGNSAFSVGGTSAFTGGTFTAGSGNVTLTGAVTVSGGTVTMGSGTEALQSTLGVTSGTFNAGSGVVTVTGATTLNGAGSAFAVGSATVGLGAFSLLGGASFNGGAGTTTFSLSPTLTSGTFTVGTAGTAGRVTFGQSATFSSGVTLTFPASGGKLGLAPGKILTLAGPVTAATTTGATKPRIDCSGCSATQGVTIAFGATSTLNVDGLEFYNSVTTGVSIASGATYTVFKNLGFKNNAGNGSSGTHLTLTLGAATLNVPGCFFDATATTNVALLGTSGQVRGARAVFELQSAARNGAGAGEAMDADGDNAPSDANPANNYGENTAAPYFGSVVQWSTVSASDIAGTAEGAPTAAFDWNTFAGYGVYAQYKNVGGAGTNDRLWLRGSDGTTAYSFDVPNSSGDLVGSPVWSTSNETTLGLDVNGDGDLTDSSVHVVYVATTGGHLIKLIDNGSSLARPASGKWVSDFTAASVTTISSPLITDSTNLYFGGTDASATKLFGVQITGGAAEKTLVKTIGAVSAVTAAPAWKRISGRVYLYVGSTATAGQAYIYRVEISPGATVQATFSAITSSVNGSVRLANDRAFAVTSGGQLFALQASDFGVGGFTTVAGFPYQTPSAQPIQAPAWSDSSGVCYFGDDSGAIYAVTLSGALAAGYPLAITTSAIISSPLYVRGSGVVAVGAADGYLYFLDRHDAAGSPRLFNRFFVGAGSVSSVAYDAVNAAYMVSSTDGRLSYVASTLVPDPTPSNE